MPGTPDPHFLLPKLTTPMRNQGLYCSLCKMGWHVKWPWRWSVGGTKCLTWMKRPPPESPLQESLPVSPPKSKVSHHRKFNIFSQVTCTELSRPWCEAAKLCSACLIVKRRNLKRDDQNSNLINLNLHQAFAMFLRQLHNQQDRLEVLENRDQSQTCIPIPPLLVVCWKCLQPSW